MTITGVGTKFRRWNATSGAWEDIANISNITGPNMSRETVDDTTLDTEGGWRTFITGFRDGGTVTLAMNYRRHTFDLMLDDFEDDSKQNYEIILPDDENTSIEFEGLVTEMPLTIPPDDKVSVDVTIKVSGAPAAESGSGPSLNA